MESVDRKFLSDVELIKKASQTKKLVIFVGAGISMNSGIPSWEQLLEELKNDIGISAKDSKDDLQIAQIYFNEKKHKEYIEKIRKVLLHKKAKYNDLNEIIFDLNPEYIITTNYDDLLEQVIKKRALPFSVIKKDTDFPYASNSNLLVKIHGDLDNDDFVLKEDDYVEYETNHPLFEAFIKSVFSTKVVLFIGYGYSDINLKIILQKVRNILGVNYQNSFLLTSNNLSNYKRSYLNNKGVNALSYEDHQEYIDSYLNGANIKNITYEINTNLKNQGLTLLKFLTFIKVYDKFKEDLSKEDILNQMYFSFLRFSEIASLPYFFIANLFPFNNKDRYIYRNEHSAFTLQIPNENILKFFKENTQLTNDNIIINESYINNIKQENKKQEVKDKLRFIINYFNYSGIYWLSNSPFDSSDSVYLDVERNKTCQCNQCLYNSLKFKQLLNFLSVSNVSETSYIKDDSSIAYAHYKLGNIYTSYTMFEEIAQKAWHAENYIIYFISKINIKRLGHMIHHAEFKSLNNELLDNLQKKSVDIDLEAEYLQINEVSKEEAELIKIIRDDDLLEISGGIINKCYDKIYSSYENSKYNERYYDNTSALREMFFYLLSISTFYEKNFIVNDYFTNFKSIFIKAFEVVFLNQIVNSKYIKVEEGINDFFCKNFILYATANDFESFFNKYHIKQIVLTVEAKEHLLSTLDNYLNSFYSINNTFGEKIEADNKLSYQTSKGFVDNMFSRHFNNMFLLLSKIQLSKNEISKIITNLAGFIEVTTFIYWHNIKFLAFFIGNCEGKFDSSMAENLLTLVIRKPNVFSTEFLAAIGYILKSSLSEDRVNNSNLIKNLIQTSSGKERNTVHYNKMNLIHIWEFSSDDSRKDIEGIFKNHLEESFDPELYFDLSVRKIINYEKFFEKYMEYVNSRKANTEEDPFTGDFESGIRNFIFINYMVFLSILEIPYTESRFDLLDNKEDYMDFYINPDKFDYDKFNIKWLLITFNSHLHQRISKYKIVRDKFAQFLIGGTENRNLKDLYIRYYIEHT